MTAPEATQAIMIVKREDDEDPDEISLAAEFMFD